MYNAAMLVGAIFMFVPEEEGIISNIVIFTHKRQKIRWSDVEWRVLRGMRPKIRSYRNAARVQVYLCQSVYQHVPAAPLQ